METAVAQQNRTVTKAEMGATLFVAKGCLTCHRHDEENEAFASFLTDENTK
jgi:cytochrome c551/c552